MNRVKIGRFIAEMRKQQNLTQREFADALGINDKTVSKWECGNGFSLFGLRNWLDNGFEQNLSAYPFIFEKRRSIRF